MRKFGRAALGAGAKQLKRFLAKRGWDVVPLRSAPGKVVGLQVRSNRDADRGLMAGYAVATHHEGEPVIFYVANERDEIQKKHAHGYFYEGQELEIIRRHYSGGTFVDVGANVGNHALFAALVMKAPRVIAFEPNPEAAVILRTNIGLNDLMERIRHRGVGLSNVQSMASISFTPDDNLGATRLAPGAGTLRLVRGDDALAEEPVGFIKIDTEGMELDVLHGLEATIARCRPTMFVEVEEGNDAAFHKLLAAYSYKVADTYQRYTGLTNYLVRPA